MSKKTEHTPMIQQYLDIKADYPDAFLFFRLGDFYELFFDEAKKAAQLLEITLTSRNKNSKEQIPMAGVPYHSAQNYIDRLIDLGYKVAICEQVEDLKLTQGMVKREVVQVITPGTVMQGEAVNENENNYLAAVTHQAANYQLAYADLTTGELKVSQLHSQEALINELSGLDVREVILEKDKLNDLKNYFKKHMDLLISSPNDEELEASLKVHLQKVPHHLEGVLRLLLLYLQETQMRALDHLQEVVVYEPSHYLEYGQNVRRNLELVTSLSDHSRRGTLLWLLDQTKTAMGSRLLRQWLEKPLVLPTDISARQDQVENLMNHFFDRADLTEALNQVYDLERLVGKIAFGTVNARDFIQLKNSLAQIPTLKAILKQLNDQEVWTQTLKQLDPVPEVYELIDHAIQEEPPLSVTEGDIIKPGFNEQLDDYLDAMKNGKKWLIDLEARERKATGINNLKIGFNKVFGYFIEITRSHLDKIEEGRYERKQTLVNSERFITDELKAMESKILEAEEKSQALEYELFIQMRAEVKKYTERLQQLAKTVSAIDVLQSFAKVSEENRYVRPQLTQNSRDVEIIQGRHPVVEHVMEDAEYVPNDIHMADDTDILLITGPNMSGKSTYMRQYALIVIMAQMGCFVPADQAKLPIMDKIFARIGAMDDLISGQSTFMVEMTETNQALAHATPNSLLLFDEIGRGTATYDGMALAEAIIEYVHDHIGAKTLFSTHYHELTTLEERLTHLKNVHVGAVEEEGQLIFLHQVSPGTADRSYGVQVAKLAGLPESLLAKAGIILERLEENKDAIFAKPDQPKEKVAEPSTAQLSLFDEERTESEDEVLAEIKALDIGTTAPLTALNLLQKLKDKLNDK